LWRTFVRVVKYSERIIFCHEFPVFWPENHQKSPQLLTIWIFFSIFIFWILPKFETKSTDGWLSLEQHHKIEPKKKPTALLLKLFIFKGKMYMSVCVELFFWMLLISMFSPQ
jgi:hypothetical protein